MEPLTTSGTNLRTAFVLLLVAAVTALFLAVAWPFLKPLLLGALLAGLFHPLYRWITRLLGGRQSLGAGVTLLVLLVLGLGPISVFLGIVLQQALTISDQAIPWLTQHLGGASTSNVHDWLVQRFPALAEYIPSQEQLLQQVGTAVKTAGAFLVGFASRMTVTTAAFLVNFLRPVFVGRDAQMPDLLILIGTLGGLFLFGPIGFIVGPIICGLFLTVWDIYGTTFKAVLPPVESFRSFDKDAVRRERANQ